MKIFSNRCFNAMNRFYALDNGEKMPFFLTKHIFFCPKCRAEVRLLTRAENSLSDFCQSERISEREFAKIMGGIAKKRRASSPVSMAGWIFGWISLFAAAFAYAILSAKTAGGASISIYLVWGLIFTAYCGAFVGGNLDFFIKKSRAIA